MIKITITKNNYIEEVIIKGHANFDEYGKDIVCSAVSTCAITTINGISEIDDECLLVIEETNKLIIRVKKESVVCDKLMSNMINIFKELMQQYPKNININIK